MGKNNKIEWLLTGYLLLISQINLLTAVYLQCPASWTSAIEPVRSYLTVNVKGVTGCSHIIFCLRLKSNKLWILWSHQHVFHDNPHENFTLCSLDKHKPPLTSLRSTDCTISASLTEQALWTHDNQSSSQSILTDRKNWQGAYRDIIHLRDLGVCRLEIWTIRVGVQYSALVLG